MSESKEGVRRASGQGTVVSGSARANTFYKLVTRLRVKSHLVGSSPTPKCEFGIPN